MKTKPLLLVTIAVALSSCEGLTVIANPDGSASVGYTRPAPRSSK